MGMSDAEAAFYLVDRWWIHSIDCNSDCEYDHDSFHWAVTIVSFLRRQHPVKILCPSFLDNWIQESNLLYQQEE